MTAPLTLYFDFVSPYAYVAWLRLPALAAAHGRTLAPVPVLFAALLDAHGQKGPAEVPAKRAYIYKDAMRKAHRAGGTLRLPPSHPFNPLLALRIASVPRPVEEQTRAIDALYAATWRDGTGVDDTDVVADVLAAAGLDASALLAAAATAEVKERVRAQTAAAVARGVFGVPTIDADGEQFWGSDSLDHLEDFLRGDDPVPRALTLPPASAVRPRST